MPKRRERPQTASNAARAKSGTGIGGLEVVGSGGSIRAAGAGLVRHSAAGESRGGEELLKLLQERALNNEGRAGGDFGGKVRSQTGGARVGTVGTFGGGRGRASWQARLDGARASASSAIDRVQEDLCVHGGKTPGGVAAWQMPASGAPPGLPSAPRWLKQSSNHSRKLWQLRHIYQVRQVLYPVPPETLNPKP